ncbi:MAG: elongation factor P [Pseudobdellovibrionaceae bacterium]
MYETSDFKKGLRIMLDGSPTIIVDFQHVKPGKGNQFTRTKLRNLLTGQNLEKTFKSGEKFDVPDIQNREMTYLYKDDNGYNFMDQTNYEQITMTDTEVGDAHLYLIENLVVMITVYNGRYVAAEVPKSVALKVARTDPGVKGNTVSGGSKPATMETGLVVQVPLHINEGDTLRVDTESGDYIERANK